MLDANMHYWTKRTNFQIAACGVLQAARDRAYSEQDVKTIFLQVGIDNWNECPPLLSSKGVSLNASQYHWTLALFIDLFNKSFLRVA